MAGEWSSLGSALELDPSAEGKRARPWIREVVDAARGHAGRNEHLWIVARVVAEEQQVVTREVDAGAFASQKARRQWERVAERDVLEAHEGAVLDPPRRELRRLLQGVRHAERFPEEVPALRGVALGRVDQRCVVEHVAAELPTAQPARIEPAPRSVVAQAECEARVGVAEDP